MKTCISLFAGGGGKTLGAQQAGFKPVLAVEMDPDIAGVYRENFPECDLEVLPIAEVPDEVLLRYKGVDALLMSPPCQQYSIARNKGLPVRDDADAGVDAIRWIRLSEPEFVFLENVPAYKKSKAFHAILDAITEMGYSYQYGVHDASDYGVPQYRKRLIMRAWRNGFPMPWPSKSEKRGWYGAIEDLLPSCPDGKLAKWQLRRLEAMGVLSAQLFVPGDGFGGDGEARPFKCGASPSPPVLSSTANLARALLVNGIPTNHAGDIDAKEAHSPSTDLTASAPKHPMRAMIRVQGQGSDLIVPESDPCPAVTSSHNPGKTRVLDGYRVVRLTSRCMARLQSVPDSYILPKDPILAGKVVGNMVPVEMARRMLDGVLD